MDLYRFKELMAKPPGQGAWEWQLFLEFMEAYFRSRKIKNPTVVEIGTRRNKQKKFYELILGAKHIGIDISSSFDMPDILGDSRDSKTLKTLKRMLKGESINLLFIDGDHNYEAVKSDYEMYGPLVSHIIAFHDISSPEYEVWKFWKEIIEDHATNEIKRSVKIGWATGLIILEGEEGIHEKYCHKGKYI